MKKLPLRVSTHLELSAAARTMKGSLVRKKSESASGVALDSRALKPGDLFFALAAVRDGHDFVTESFEKGAAGAVVHRDLDEDGSLIRVEDTLKALAALARDRREKWGGLVVGISGSNGKTTTKEIISALLQTGKPTLKAPGTWNNNLGVPLTLLMLEPKHKAAVLEMGLNHFGELRELAQMAKPDIGVLTNVGPVHLEKLQSVEGVARAKAELFESLGPKAVAVVNIDDRRIRELSERLLCRRVHVSLQSTDAHVSLKIAEDRGPEGLLLQVRYGKEHLELETALMGTHNAYNILCALGVSYAAGLPADLLQKGLSDLTPPEMRLEKLEVGGVLIVNDCYNANPASTTVALETTAALPGKRKIAVLGDMMELGDFAPRAHRDIGLCAARLNFSHLFVLGQYAVDVSQGAIQGGMDPGRIKVGTSREELSEAVGRLAEEGDVVLIKGSRGMRMENVTMNLQEHLGGKR